MGSARFQRNWQDKVWKVWKGGIVIGYDIGTYNLVCCRRDDKNNFVYKREVNAFIEIPIDNRFIFNMMKQAGVPLIERAEANIAYALGEASVNMAYTMNQIELRRPMKDGCLNPKEKFAQQMMAHMVHSLLGELSNKKETLYYSIPANAINEETDADYHSLVLKAIFDAFEDETGNKVDARPINEALALVYAELRDKNYTGVAVSCGSGMSNICFARFGVPVFQFAVVGSGDWIDKQAAKATGESPSFINKEKTKLDLTVNSESMIQRAIKFQYELMIKKTVAEIKRGFDTSGNKARIERPVDFVVAGGTASPKGFEQLFEAEILNAKLPIEVGKVIKPSDPLYSVSRGTLLAAEASVQ